MIAYIDGGDMRIVYKPQIIPNYPTKSVANMCHNQVSRSPHYCVSFHSFGVLTHYVLLNRCVKRRLLLPSFGLPFLPWKMVAWKLLKLIPQFVYYRVKWVDLLISHEANGESNSQMKRMFYITPNRYFKLALKIFYRKYVSMVMHLSRIEFKRLT